MFKSSSRSDLTSIKIYKYASLLSLFDQLNDVCLPESESTAMSRTKINNFVTKQKVSFYPAIEILI